MGGTGAVIFFVVLLGGAGLLFLLMMAGIILLVATSVTDFSGRRAKAEADAPRILDLAFDGREDVVFTIGTDSPSYETVLLGAKQRGYVLTSATNDSERGWDKTLIFERAAGRPWSG